MARRALTVASLSARSGSLVFFSFRGLSLRRSTSLTSSCRWAGGGRACAGAGAAAADCWPP
eukprot:7409349-Alexandrium_andersonii.AAC.1